MVHGYPVAMSVRDEAAPYYARYIDRVPAGDIVPFLEAQLGETLALYSRISEEKSQHRYAPDKWSIRQLVGHVNDSERIFLHRALWFARGYESPLAGFDEAVAARTGGADAVSWAGHVEEWRAVRQATLVFFRHLPAEAWDRQGVASDNPVSVRALAYIIGGHLAHHRGVLEERYL
jgi:hypothetical protein